MGLKCVLHGKTEFTYSELKSDQNGIEIPMEEPMEVELELKSDQNGIEIHRMQPQEDQGVS